jgi:hypothetical protein
VSTRANEEGKTASFPPGLLTEVSDTAARTLIRRSKDFGEHWESVSAVSAAENLIDVTPGSENHVVLIAGAARPSLVPSSMVSDDGGVSFGPWLNFSPSPNLPLNLDQQKITRKENAWIGQTLVLPDGSHGSVFWDHFWSEGGKYEDVGITWRRLSADGIADGPPVTIAKLSNSAPPRAHTADSYLRSSGRARQFHYPSAAVGPVPGSGLSRIYVAWHDVVGNRMRILISHSDDSGSSWSSPLAVDDGSQKRRSSDESEPLLPSVAVNRAGVVGILWREHEGRCWRFAASRDGGESFERSVEINACDPKPTAFNELLSKSLASVFPLETVNPQGTIVEFDWRQWSAGFRGIALVTTPDSIFHAAWSPFAQDDDPLYSSRIYVDDSEAFRKRTAVNVILRQTSLAHSAQAATPQDGIEDGRVWVNYSSLDYDSHSHELSVAVSLTRLRNRSSRWPAVLRVKELSSCLGPVSADGADNALPNKGAAWLFEGPKDKPPAQASVNWVVESKNFDSVEFSELRVLHYKLQTTPMKSCVDTKKTSGELLHVTYDVILSGAG